LRPIDYDDLVGRCRSLIRRLFSRAKVPRRHAARLMSLSNRRVASRRNRDDRNRRMCIAKCMPDCYSLLRARCVRRGLSRVGLNYLSAFLVIFKPLLAFHRSRGSSVRMGNKMPRADGSEQVVFAIVTGWLLTCERYVSIFCFSLHSGFIRLLHRSKRSSVARPVGRRETAGTRVEESYVKHSRNWRAFPFL